MNELKASGRSPIAALEEAIAQVMEQEVRASIQPVVSSRTEAKATSTAPQSDDDKLLNRVIGRVLGVGAILLGLAVLMAMLRFLWRLISKTATIGKQLVQETSTADIARAAGHLTGAVEKRAKPLLEAFKKGRNDLQ